MLYHPGISNTIVEDIEYTFEELNDSKTERFNFLNNNNASSELIPFEKKEKMYKRNLLSTEIFSISAQVSDKQVQFPNKKSVFQ
jgi:hypothetical protein